MFFKNKYKIKCKVYCSDKSSQYGSDDDGKNTRINITTFNIVEPESLQHKVLYDYSDQTTNYQIGQYYDAILNSNTGEFIIKE